MDLNNSVCFNSLLFLLHSFSTFSISVEDHNDTVGDFNLPAEHIPYHLKRSLKSGLCKKSDLGCPYKEYANFSGCWGYEKDCEFASSFSYHHIKCPEPSRWPNARTKEDQIRLFWHQGDFGYLLDRVKEIREFCSSDPKAKDGCSLSCSDHMRYCYAKNIFFDFKSFKSADSTPNRNLMNKYREDIIHDGEVGGYCTKKFDKMFLKSRGDQKSPLQSWAAELLPFESYSDFRMDSNHCDIIYEKPTILIKLDAAVNMYHHFCDFVNLYASQHINGSFSRDVHIVLWDTSIAGFYDPTFGLTWKVFTAHPLIHLKDLDGKRVCFREAMFPLLARQILGFYYNMPIVNGCYGSGFFHAFSKHVLKRLNIEQNGPLRRKIRVTLLSRTTKYRRMLNEEELVGALKTIVEFEVRLVDFTFSMPFGEQLQWSHNTDIFIGMHGSGLTHLLFLPDWGGVFEVYHCEDPNCYMDLAHLRGVYYRSWENKKKLLQEDEGHHPSLGAHAKFTNYAFDVEEFVRIVSEIADHVRNHPAYIAEQERLDENIKHSRQQEASEKKRPTKVEL